MLNYDEEQQNELQALEAIYPNELTVISRTPRLKFSFQLRCEDNSEEQTDDEYSITLSFEYTTKYPDEPPLIEVTDQSETIDDDLADELLNKLNDEASQQTGMVMIFTLVSTVLEWLNSLKENASERRRLVAERKKQLEEEQEMKRFEGTRVTVDSFMKWKISFDAEMAQIRATERDKDVAIGKLSGRQLFEKDRTLNDSDLKFLEDGDVAAEIDASGVKVDTSLFEDLDIDVEEIDDDE